MILGMLINAISMGEVIIPNMPKIMLSTPAVYSFWRQASKPNIKASGLKTRLSNEFIKKYSEGAGEIELVRSGLDDTMVNAYQAMSETWNSRDDVDSLRLAAYLLSIERIASTYHAKGLWRINSYLRL